MIYLIVFVIIIFIIAYLNEQSKKELEHNKETIRKENERIKTESGFYFAQKFLDFKKHAEYYSAYFKNKRNLEFVPNSIISAVNSSVKEKDMTFHLLNISTNCYVYEIRSTDELFRDYSDWGKNTYLSETRNTKCFIDNSLVIDFDMEKNPNDECASWTDPEMNFFQPSGWEMDILNILEEINNIKPLIESRDNEIKKNRENEKRKQEEDIFNSLKLKTKKNS